MPSMGSKHSEKCRQRIETEMRRENDPRVKRAEDAYTDFEAEKMQAQEAIDARRAAEATRRGGGEDDDNTPPENAETAASSSSGAIGHISSEVTDRAAEAPISRAALAPISKNGSVGSAPSTVVTSTTNPVRQGDRSTEEQVRQKE